MRLLVCVSLSVLACVSIAARAQTLDEDELSQPRLRQLATITDIPDEASPPARRAARRGNPYAPLGIRSGSFTFFPEVELGVIATTNARQSTNGTADIAGFIRPSLGWQSDWPRHAWNGNIGGRLTRFARDEDLRGDEVSVDSNFRLDIRRNLILDIDKSYDLTASASESSSNNPAAGSDQINQTMRLATTLRHELGRIQTRSRLAVSRSINGDSTSAGVTTSNDDRNATDLEASLRVTYQNDAVLSPFLGIGYTPRFFDANVDRDGLRRSSQGFTSELGVVIADEPFWSGEVAATYGLRRFEDSTLDTESVFGLNAALTWRPTELTSVQFTSSAGLTDGLTSGVSASREWTTALTATHQLRDNISAFAGSSLKVTNSTDTDFTAGARIGANWAFNPYLVWQASYEGTWFTSGTSSNNNYNDQRVLTSIILRR